MRCNPIYPIILTASLSAAWPANAQQTPGATVSTAQKRTDDSSDPSGFIGLGGAIIPKYDGSESYKPSPFVIGNVEWKGLDLQFRGKSARLDVISSDAVQFGPVLVLRSGRDQPDGDGRVALLPGIDDAVEVGAFAGYRFGGDATGEGEVAITFTALKDVSDTHDGFLASAQISYAVLRGKGFTLDVDAETTYGDKKYTRTYFGVTPEQAEISGLDPYRPGAGLQDVSAGLTAGVHLSGRWGLIGRLGGSYYVGDAKDSPIVDEGSKFQGMAALGLTFRF
ncbi:MipA/OmpV family protein [Aurantiacibacter flavus]|uniref:MipA/OmpV family protein n=1 Tax=Aurantiacibacter flavus TaxID=3145232 RepID=A0ABV0CZC1_9SPHN